MNLVHILANHFPSLWEPITERGCFSIECSCALFKRSGPTKRSVELDWAEHVTQEVSRERNVFYPHYVSFQVPSVDPDPDPDPDPIDEGEPEPG